MNCENLKYLDFSNLYLNNIESLEGAFNNCGKLIYANFRYLKAINSANINDALDKIPTNAKFCLLDEYTQNYLLTPKGFSSNCSDNCFNKNIKLDIVLNECIETCQEHNYEYECNNICYHACPENTFVSVTTPYICYDNTPIGYYLDSSELIYKECYSTCKYCYGPGDDLNHNCKICKSGFINSNNDKNCYLNCNYYFYIDESNNYHCTLNDKCPENYKNLILANKQCIDNCKKDSRYPLEYKNTCYDCCPVGAELMENFDYCYSIEMNLEEFDEYLKYIQKLLLKGFNTSDIDEGNDIIFSNGKVTISITSISNQKNNNYINISTINFGKCESLLREEYSISNNSNLYILKIDDYISKLNKLKVEYEVYYYPLSESFLKKADLSLCKNEKIEISIPVNLSSSEMDKYNQSSGYYNDICYTLTTEKGTDECLEDRRNEFIDNNLSICDEDCQFSEYDYENKKAICSCITKITLPLISQIQFNKEKLLNNFVDIHNIANIKVLKCIKSFFNKNNMFKNAANYLMIILFLLGTTSVFVFCFYNKIKIKEHLNQICLENILDKGKIKVFNGNKNKKEKKISNNNKLKLKGNEPPKIKNKNKKQNKKNKVQFNNSNNNNLNKEKSKKLDTEISPRKNKIIKKKKINVLTEGDNRKIKNNRIKNYRKKKYESESSDYALKKESMNFQKEKKKIEDQKTLEKEEIEKYTDIEMNLLKYEEAIKSDQRTYWQYYLSLLRTKHILIFTIYPNKDYNSQIIKIYIFLLTFFINYSFSAMFYTDSTMHKIYVDEGSFDFTYQLPQMLYSLIISSVLKIILNILGLYGNKIIEVKNKKKDITNESIIKISKIILIKISFFFILTYIIIFFFWIYLGCFCYVYHNTQVHLLLDVVISFLITFVVYFIIYLIPGIFRMCSLKSRKGESPKLYKFSLLLQMI